MKRELHEIVGFMNQFLRIAEISDSSNALNGLQIENDGTVTKIALAVDATLATLQAAINVGADLLIVHHGMFWSGLQPVTGLMRQKISLALQHNLAIYSSHLPLDAHPMIGNNACLAKLLSLSSCEAAVEYHGEMIGIRGEFSGNIEELRLCLEKGIQSSVIGYFYGGSNPNPVYISSGDSSSALEELHSLGAKTLITGEISHSAITLAQDLGVNLLFGGHYATETLGVQALGALVTQEYNIPSDFISLPTQA